MTVYSHTCADFFCQQEKKWRGKAETFVDETYDCIYLCTKKFCAKSVTRAVAHQKVLANVFNPYVVFSTFAALNIPFLLCIGERLCTDGHRTHPFNR